MISLCCLISIYHITNKYPNIYRLPIINLFHFYYYWFFFHTRIRTTESESIFDPLDVRCQQLVLDVVNNRVILNRKQDGARSQLWRMTVDGLLQHEGSSPPTDPTSKNSSSNSNNILVNIINLFRHFLLYFYVSHTYTRARDFFYPLSRELKIQIDQTYIFH